VSTLILYFTGSWWHGLLQVGSDANAGLLKEALAGAGVDVTFLRQVPGASGTALILLQHSGQENGLLYPM
jgi:sugar/nucleoside kinase (ribokinase family)